MTTSDREKLAEVMARGVIKGTGIDDLDALLIIGDQIKAIEAAERAAFLEAHDPALANYAAASPQNAATLRNLIMGTD